MTSLFDIFQCDVLKFGCTNFLTIVDSKRFKNQKNINSVLKQLQAIISNYSKYFNEKIDYSN